MDLDQIRHLVRRTNPIEYFPGSNAVSVNNRVLPSALPSIWNCVSRLLADGTIELDINYMKSANLSISDFITFLRNCGLTVISTNPLRLREPNITEIVSVASSNQPAFLTEEQIEEILKDFPIFPGALESTMEVTERGIKNFYREQLRREKISPLALPLIKQMIISKLRRSILPGGVSVGLMDADAIAAQMMQATLNTKHEAGKATSIMQKLNALSELLKGAKTKNPVMTLFFENRKITKPECQTYVERYEYITLLDICQDITVENNELIEYWWIPLYCELEGIALPEIEDLLLIKLNQQAMYNQNITMQDVVEVLKFRLENIIIVASPMQVGEIYLLPDPEATRELLEKRKIEFDVDFANFVYLDTILLPEIKNFPIKGIEGINLIETKYRTLNSYFVSSDKLENGRWRLDFHIYNMRKDCVIISDLENLLKFLKIKIIQISSDPRRGGEADHFVLDLKEEPIKFINDKITADLKKFQERQEEERKVNAIYLAPDTELMKANRVYYLRTEGSNLREIFLDDTIDSRYSYSNDMREMFSIFGIGVMRIIMMTNLADIMKSDLGSVDSAFILLQTDAFCHRGKLSGIDFSGQEENQSDIMGLISSQRPTQLTLRWASTGAYKSFKGVSSAIAIGKVPNVGSGAITITEDKEMIKRLAESGSKLDPDLIKASLARLKPNATPVSRPVNLVKPIPPKSSAIETGLSTKQPSAPLSAQPTLTTRSELLDKAVKPLVNIPEVADKKVISTIIRKAKPQSQVFLTSDLPVYQAPEIARFDNPPGLPRDITKLIKENQ